MRVEIDTFLDAAPARVWALMLDPEGEWMGGFRFASSWTVGGALAVRGTLNGEPYEESGTPLALEPGVRLRYDHWSRLWRVPDTLEHHAVLELRLEPEGEGTRLHVRHDVPDITGLHEHSAWFWGVAVGVLKALAEGR